MEVESGQDNPCSSTSCPRNAICVVQGGEKAEKGRKENANDHHSIGPQWRGGDKPRIRQSRYNIWYNFWVFLICIFFCLFLFFFLTAGDEVPSRELVAAYCVRNPVCISAPFLSGDLGQ